MAGGGSAGGVAADGTGSAAKFTNPKGVTVSTSGAVYVADAGNNLIRMISPTGTSPVLMIWPLFCFLKSSFVLLIN